MKRRVVAILAACALALSSCGGEVGSPPIETVTPTPWPGDPIERGTPSPSPTPTPSQAELSARAEGVYRTFFDEVTRLERLGGADQPTQVLLDNGAENYLDITMALLRKQKEVGYAVDGPLPNVKVVPAPGQSRDGADPRYTLKVCEDYSRSRYSFPDGPRPGVIAEGAVYFREIDGTLKLVRVRTEETNQCTL